MPLTDASPVSTSCFAVSSGVGSLSRSLSEGLIRPGFVADLAMAWVLAGMVGHLGAVTIRSAEISALFAWGGFVLTTVLVNNAFSGRSYALTMIDAGHWLLTLIVMGAVIGWIGI